MLNDHVYDGLNKQVNAEIFSAYFYLSMATYFDSMNLNGFAHWMRVQSREELSHAMKLSRYVHDRGRQVLLGSIEAPQSRWQSPLAVFEDAYKHEQSISVQYDRLVELSNEHRDHATGVFLQWFLTEQVEEEASVDNMARKLRLIGESISGLFMLDRELAGRQ
ncbi:MAG: ferritin [Candidatus Schekmanbacteria bacterium]|nr:ferritin [Candidatus Schekmanbacteria bacterium]